MEYKNDNITYKINKDGCYICTNHKPNKEGYFYLQRNGKKWLMHRYFFTKAFGKIPEGLVVRHKCDNPSCINVNHMELGTNADNTQDRVDRGRSAIGEKHGSAKLTVEDVVFIKKHLNSNNTVLAKLFNVDGKTIRSIRNNKAWTFVDENKFTIINIELENKLKELESIYFHKAFRKLNDQQVKEIKLLHINNNLSERKIATIIGCSRSTVHDILSGKCYKEIV